MTQAIAIFTAIFQTAFEPRMVDFNPDGEQDGFKVQITYNDGGQRYIDAKSPPIGFYVVAGETVRVRVAATLNALISPYSEEIEVKPKISFPNQFFQKKPRKDK